MQDFGQTSFQFENCTAFYRGKVRDIYSFGDTVVVVATDRISAFDVVLPRNIPYKGQVLNQMAYYFLSQANDIMQNWVLDSPHPNVTIGRKCEPFKVEMLIRAYLVGHAWREYKKGKRQLCGVALPEGLKENDRLPVSIITPTTKATKGHDEDISREDILRRQLVSENDYEQMTYFTRELFNRGTAYADAKGLILADTKYEFGKYEDQIYLIDEIHTPDSSRYFYKEGYEERQRKAMPQKQLSKEFVRQWLMENNFQGYAHQKLPTMTDDFTLSVSDRYIALYEKLIGKTFVKVNYDTITNDIEKSITKFFN